MTQSPTFSINNNSKSVIKMKLLKPSLLASSTLLLALTGTAFGEANMSFSAPGGTAPSPVNANVKFTINVPEILILRIGDWGATENNPIWNYAFGGHASLSGASPSYAGGNATQADWDSLTSSIPEQTATTDGTLQVAVFSNTGKAKLSISAINDFDPVATGFAKPSLSEIEATSGGSSTPIDPANLNTFAVGNAVDLTAVAGIAKATDTWTYKYQPTTTPAAGKYDASVTYTLASL
ncbi:hypothetical protein [Thiothrix subterranea]|uniref:WxL domain-containing protein n=1 Tax=Thiothrix subterranea TaxID=2735563 RepID=A0AA51R0I4_9GAMM|nr:hypothetical protein [Thiothrix subterranea]MDQ5767081.1 hypothetical protein [Thiothrix subterranea]WML88057.1 hypothetical protein RCG00_06710 [Thiothrix subterranea]